MNNSMIKKAIPPCTVLWLMACGYTVLQRATINPTSEADSPSPLISTTMPQEQAASLPNNYYLRSSAAEEPSTPANNNVDVDGMHPSLSETFATTVFPHTQEAQPEFTNLVENNDSANSYAAYAQDPASVELKSEMPSELEMPSALEIPPVQPVAIVNIPALASLNHLTANVPEPFDRTRETPVLWKLMRTGNVSLLPYLADCLNLVVASEVGVTLSEDDAAAAVVDPNMAQESSSSNSLNIVTLPSERRYVNVDTTTEPGLQHAKELGLISSGLADVVVSPYFQQATTSLFENTDKKARFFTVMRHPVDKVVSKFYFLKKTSAETGKNAWVQDMTLEDYVNSEYAESNFMVRSLTNKKSDILSREDIEVAKQILRQKFLVGLSSHMSESMDRIQTYFGWEGGDHMRLGVMHRAQECKAQYLKEEHIQNHKVEYAPLAEGSELWESLRKKNWADVSLFEYVRDVLFQEQGSMFAQPAMGMPVRRQ